MKGFEFEFRPDTPGLVTETWIVPAVATRIAGMVADSCEEFCQTAGNDDVPKLTAAPGRKFEPRTLRLKEDAPAVTCCGLMDSITGMADAGKNGPDAETIGTE